MMHYTNPDARALVFAQVYSFKAGLKKFGEVGSKAAVNKLTQLHDYHVYNPVRVDSLTPAKQKMELKLFIIILRNTTDEYTHAPLLTAAKNGVNPDTRKRTVLLQLSHRTAS